MNFLTSSASPSFKFLYTEQEKWTISNMTFTGIVFSELRCLSEVRRNFLVLLTDLGSHFCSGCLLHLQIPTRKQAPGVTVCCQWSLDRD